ncbi:phosphate ABC transporter substrate-binding protein [Trinickia symbiotica]|uniref:Phosphate ABC transporter substrate-binding protein n=1 Tax=Trinickia symbiotica TaxID=863227 RepID=A0A2T3XK34_9BURK|nr:phosphate ABC transporter substrate-binding protein [Trinickia symbiotica]PTB16890.1 phosphate ABC transporter substrate-binding protein [Trinickia symbiotica]
MHGIKRKLTAVLIGAILALCATVCDAQIVVIVSAKSRLTSLTVSDVADIYLGRMSQLPDGVDVVPIDYNDDNAQRAEFYKLVAGKSLAQLRAYWPKLIFTGRGVPPRTAADARAVKKIVAASPNAIGYIDRSELDSSVKAVLTLH